MEAGRRGSLYALLALAAVLLLFGIYRHQFTSTDRLSEKETTDAQLDHQTKGDKLYKNFEFGYSFNYPGVYTIEQYSSSDISIGKHVNGAFIPAIDVHVVYGSGSSYDAFVKTEVKKLCEAGGAGACGKPVSSEPYTTPTGLLSSVMHLAPAATVEPPVRFGPVYAFHIGANVQDVRFAALLFTPPASHAADPVLMKQIVDSVRIDKI